MNLSLQDLQAEAAATGFPVETLDKVIRLIELLNAFRGHPFLKDRLSALFTRHASRDLFDAHAQLGRDDLDRDKLRLGFIVYGACSRRDWRTVSPEDIGCDHKEFQQQLVPVLSRDVIPAGDEMNAWIGQLVRVCRERVGLVLPFEDHEREFLVRVNEQGEIAPELLTGDDELAARIKKHPQLLWKVKHVREHRGLKLIR